MTSSELALPSLAVQFSAFSNSAARIGSTGIGGSSVSSLSPQLWEKSTSTSQNRSEMLPVPSMCHGEVPSSVPRKRTEKRPTPNSLTDSDAEIVIVEVERRELEERVEAEVALDARRC